MYVAGRSFFGDMKLVDFSARRSGVKGVLALRRGKRNA
jgi:hypothetical protein